MSKGTVLTNDKLKRILTDAMLFRNHADDFDTMTEAGVYNFDLATQNKPSFATGYGTAVVISNGMFPTVQMVFNHDTLPTMGLRTKTSSTTWSDWKQLAFALVGGVKRCTYSAREQKGGARYEYQRKAYNGLAEKRRDLDNGNWYLTAVCERARRAGKTESRQILHAVPWSDIQRGRMLAYRFLSTRIPVVRNHAGWSGSRCHVILHAVQLEYELQLLNTDIGSCDKDESLYPELVHRPIHELGVNTVAYGKEVAA